MAKSNIEMQRTYGKQNQIKTCYRLYFEFLHAVRTVQVI